MPMPKRMQLPVKLLPKILLSDFSIFSYVFASFSHCYIKMSIYVYVSLTTPFGSYFQSSHYLTSNYKVPLQCHLTHNLETISTIYFEFLVSVYLQAHSNMVLFVVTFYSFFFGIFPHPSYFCL